MIYGYGIDLGQSLNYSAIIVTKVDKNIRLVGIRKYKKLTYPELQENLFNDLFERFPPEYICVDYTNERSFAETMEAKFNSLFMDQYSSGYQKWTKVRPIVFTQDIKLSMKQNASEIFEKKQFVWPKRLLTDPRAWSLIEELKEQMMRESGSPGANGQLKFPKPEGRDNDLIIALEMNLYGAKRFLSQNNADPWYIPRYNPYEKYICVECKKGNHMGRPHYVYNDLTGGEIGCPCNRCNGL